MKRLSGLLLIFCGILILSNVVCAAQKSTQKSPVAFIPNPEYEFQSVLEGTEVTHEFVIKNNGNALLFVEKVKTN